MSSLNKSENKSESKNQTRNESFFRMLSIALLGAVALACVPDSQASSPYVNVSRAAEEVTVVMGQAIPVEIESVQEVNDINAGRFNPAVTGDLKQLAEVSRSQAFTALFDPNL